MLFNVKFCLKNNAFESRPHFEKSFALYVEAYYAHTQSDRKLAITKLQEAIKMAQIDEVDDLTYQYNLSRLLMLEKRFEEARPLMESMVKRILEFLKS
jgi:tetratricopeptide (TPR) repeat protein